MSALLLFASKILFVVFFLGSVGSLVVIVITFIEDLELFFSDEESAERKG